MAKHVMQMAVALVVLLTARSVLAGEPAETIYGQLLSQYVKDGTVDYAGLKIQEKHLDASLESLASIDPASLNRDDQLAYYINCYNFWTLKLILEHYPGIRSIKEAGSLFRSPWKRKFVRLAGGVVSLDEIEQGILRPRFGDPRVHFAINCASKSCPPLAAVPYRGDTLDAALEAATSSFINTPGNTYFKNGSLHVSRIFDWYAEDFGGEKGVWEFVRRYAGPELARQMDAATDHTLAYTDYDWSLNGK